MKTTSSKHGIYDTSTSDDSKLSTEYTHMTITSHDDTTSDNIAGRITSAEQYNHDSTNDGTENTDDVTNDKNEDTRRLPDATSTSAETCDAYVTRLNAMGALDVCSFGLPPTWQRWISPLIGHMPIATLSPNQLYAVRIALAQKLAGRRISVTTADAVWRMVRTTLHHAAHATHRSFHVRRDDPSARIPPPTARSRKSQAPVCLARTEFTQLVSCESVPVEHRRVYAIATYTCMRAGELAALTWADVDLVRGEIHVDKTITDQGRGRVQRVHRSRIVPIVGALLPLLVAMRPERASNGAYVLPSLRRFNSTLGQLREHLRLAGIMRKELSNAVFRLFRHTGIAWLVQARLPLNASIYVSSATVASRIVGPLPALPDTLLKSGTSMKGGGQ